MENFPKIEGESSEILRKFRAQDFIHKFFINPEFKSQMSNLVDISAPKLNDIKSIENGTFQVSNFICEPENNFVSLRIGGTEFHLTDEAAKFVLG